MKVYISGKISGIEEQAYQLFEEAENKLKMFGYEVVNPMKLPHEHDKEWHSYMKEDIKALCDCDAICLLDNWESSIGANIEFELAKNLKMAKIELL